MMKSNAEGAATALIAAHSGASLLPVPDKDLSLDEAYAIQRQIHATSGLPVMVWKLGLTADGPRSALGAKESAVGRLPASAIYSDRGIISFSPPEMYAEAEVIFELIDDLPPRDAPYTRETVLPAIGAIYGGIEIVSTRFEKTGLPLGWLVADNVMAHGLVLGKKLAVGWDDKFADCPATLIRNDEEPVQGSTARVLGNPLDAFIWLANWLCANGEGGLKREQLVASGTATGATQIFAGDTINVSFDGLPAAQVSLFS